MKKISMIEKQTGYVAPIAVEVTFESEGPICGSVVEGGFGAGGFGAGGDEEGGDVDFF